MSSKDSQYSERLGNDFLKAANGAGPHALSRASALAISTGVTHQTTASWVL